QPTLRGERKSTRPARRMNSADPEVVAAGFNPQTARYPSLATARPSPYTGRDCRRRSVGNQSRRLLEATGLLLLLAKRSSVWLAEPPLVSLRGASRDEATPGTPLV